MLRLSLCLGRRGKNIIKTLFLCLRMYAVMRTLRDFLLNLFFTWKNIKINYSFRKCLESKWNFSGVMIVCGFICWITHWVGYWHTRLWGNVIKRKFRERTFGKITWGANDFFSWALMRLWMGGHWLLLEIWILIKNLML